MVDLKKKKKIEWPYKQFQGGKTWSKDYEK